MATRKITLKPRPVRVARVHPLAMSEARRLAGGHTARLRTLDVRTVLVLNFPGQQFRHARRAS